jgi:hypothetical protein
MASISSETPAACHLPQHLVPALEAGASGDGCARRRVDRRCDVTLGNALQAMPERASSCKRGSRLAFCSESLQYTLPLISCTLRIEFRGARAARGKTGRGDFFFARQGLQ